MNFAQLASMLGFQRTLMVPLIIGEQRIGLLQVSNKLSGEDFTHSRCPPDDDCGGASSGID